VFTEAGMLSPQARCATFDADADGYVRGEGCGVVVLERRRLAELEGDRVRALIRGSAVNQDGRSNTLTAPNGPAQQDVIRRALVAGGVHPAEVTLVEAHGTGTPLGDPIEVGALVAAYGREGVEEPLWVGSVKTNIGHLEAAAGIAGLIKTVLALEHSTVPAHLHLRALNPYIDLTGTRCRIPEQTLPWAPSGRRPRIAAVSSFGFGGTNAHVVLEQAPAAPEEPHSSDRDEHLNVLPFSAKTSGALEGLAAGYADLLSGTGSALRGLAYTAATRRAHHAHRRAVVASSAAEVAARRRRRAPHRRRRRCPGGPAWPSRVPVHRAGRAVPRHGPAAPHPLGDRP
jgi:acyl transferase domain-containing protein